MNETLIDLFEETYKDYEDAMYDAQFEDAVPVTPMNRAGLDDLTPVDVFMECNGRNVWLEEDYATLRSMA